MNRPHTTLAIITLCALIVGWQLWQAQPMESVPADGGLAASDGQDASPARTSDPEAASTPGRGDANPDPFDFARRIEENPDCRPETMVRNPVTGEIEQAWTCAPATGDPHPYENWSEAVLAGLAYGDAKAAEVLGLRHIRSADPSREALGLMLLYRSVALSGETAALHRAISTRYAVVSNGTEPDVHNLRQLLIFSIVTARLGDATISQSTIESRLAKARVTAPQIREIRSTADQILEQMADIQRAVTGNTSIGEVLSNA